MYNVKGPSKIVAKTTRRGNKNCISQNIESFRDHSRCKSDENELNNGPKPVFQSVYKRTNSLQRKQDAITPQHEEIINYINESWNSVYSEMKQSSYGDNSRPKSEQSIYYQDDPRPQLKDFKPFDLESWWGKRLYTYITNSVNTKS